MKLEKTADAARAIKAGRLAQGLTQQALADRVGIARQSLARIEKGSGGAAFDTYLSLFEALGITLETHSRAASAEIARPDLPARPARTMENTGRAIALVPPLDDERREAIMRLGREAAKHLSQVATSALSFDEFRTTMTETVSTDADGESRRSPEEERLAHLRSVIESHEPMATDGADARTDGAG